MSIDNLIPFDEDWDLSQIAKHEKVLILFSRIMYTTFLEKILENDNNSNIILDGNNNPIIDPSFNPEQQDPEYDNIDAANTVAPYFNINVKNPFSIDGDI